MQRNSRKGSTKVVDWTLVAILIAAVAIAGVDAQKKTSVPRTPATPAEVTAAAADITSTTSAVATSDGNNR